MLDIKDIFCVSIGIGYQDKKFIGKTLIPSSMIDVSNVYREENNIFTFVKESFHPRNVIAPNKEIEIVIDIFYNNGTTFIPKIGERHIYIPIFSIKIINPFVMEIKTFSDEIFYEDIYDYNYQN